MKLPVVKTLQAVIVVAFFLLSGCGGGDGGGGGDQALVPVSFNGIAASGTQLVAVGSSGSIVTSPIDGNDWKLQASVGSDRTLQGIIWSGTQFVAIGSGIFTSTDGISWTERLPKNTNYLYSVAWSGTEYVAVGFYGTILSSPDGITWTPCTSGTSDTLQGKSKGTLLIS